MKTATKAIALLMSICLGAFASFAGTGWIQTTGGAQQFLDPANWDEGDVNGVFPAGWTSGTASTHSIRITNDWSGTIRFYGNIVKEITFVGYNAANTKAEARTITLTDDLVIQPAVSQYSDSRLTFDANIGFNLGGVTRTFFGNSAIGGKLRFNGPISNGNLVIDGDGAIISLLSTSAVDGNVTVRPNTTFAFDYPGSATFVQRAKNVELHRATLSVNARNASDTALIDTLTVTGADVPGMSVLQVANNNKLAIVEADSLSIVDGGALAIMAGAPGAATDAASGSRILFAIAPGLSGSGVAGSVSAPLLPAVVVGPNSTVANIVGQYGNNQLTLATYDETVGLRKLSDDETANTVSADAVVNLVVPSATTLTLDANATVNSLQMRAAAYNSASEKITGDFKLTVQSGMVLATAPKDGAKIDVALDFGANTGYLIAGGAVNYGVDISKPVAGTGGLVLTKGMVPSYDTTIVPSTNARGFNVASSSGSTYTGDTYVQCIVEAGSSDFLPHGSRSGDTIVNGCLSFDTIALNGLYGTGAVRGTTLTVGEDGSDSRFAGSAYLTSSLNITNSTFVLDGSVTQGAVNVAAGAAIGGSGGITNNLVFASGAKLAVTVVDGVATCLAVAGEVSGGPVTVNANVRSGKWRTAQRILTSRTSMGEMTFVKGAGVGALELRENGTELWATPRKAGFYVVIQ